ncbi:MAG: benzoate-CoA ligase family protein [Nitrososphaerota archaeon]
MRTSVIPEAVQERFNVVELHLDRWIKNGLAERVALIDLESGEETTYRELHRLACRFSNVLAEHSLELFDRVMIAMRDSRLSVASFLGAMRAGMVPFYVNPNYGVDEFKFFIRDSRCRAIIADRSTAEKLEVATREVGKHVKAMVNVDRDGFSDFLEGFKDEYPLAETHKDDPAYIVYTSGTTGRPKGAVHLHHDLVYAVGPYVSNVIDVREGDVFYSASKLYFSAGRMFGLHIPLMCGATSLIDPERSTPERVLAAISGRDVTHLLCVPTLYLRILNHLERLGVRTLERRALRYCVSGGEPLPASVFERWREVTGLEILNGIGSSEAEWIFISYRQGECKPGSSGKVVPGWEAKLVDESGQEVTEPYKVGVLYISSDSVAAFYWRRSEETRRTFIGRWYNTMDMLYFDQDGYLHYVGRSDDLFKVHGMWVSPAEVEDAILATGLVQECAVIGLPTSEGLTEVVAFVVPKDPSNQRLEEELKAALADRIPRYKIPSKVLTVDEIPKTATGKVRRTALREMAMSGLIKRAGEL